MTITEFANTSHSFLALRIAGDGSVSAEPFTLFSSARAEDGELTITSIALPPPPTAAPESATPTLADILAAMDPVTITSTDVNSAIVGSSLGYYFNTGNFTLTANFVGNLQYDYGLGAGPQSLDILAMSDGVNTFVVPLAGTMPPVIDEASLDLFLAAVTGLSPTMSSVDITAGPVSIEDFTIGAVTDESVDLFGDMGNDTFEGTSGDDYMFGGGGADVFFGYGGNDYIDANVFGPVAAAGEAETATSYGGTGNDIFADEIYGGAGNDYMIASEAGATMNGGAGADHHDGTLGYTIADYSDSSAGVEVMLQFGTGTGGDAEGDTYVDVNEVVGSAYADVIALNGRVGAAHGEGGDDRMFGLGGSDVMYGGTGNDTMRGGRDEDSLFGGDGNDEISAQGEGGLMSGDAGNDLLLGDSGNDIIYGGDNDDIAYGGDDGDYINGDNGADMLYGEKGQDVITGGNGNDRLFGGQEYDQIFGGGDDDWMHGGGSEDYLSGGSGNDRLFGDGGNDTLNGDFGRDVVFGGAGEDALYFGNGDDNLHGGADADTFIFSQIELTASPEAGAVPGVDETRIFDFTTGEDTIDVSQGFLMDLADVLAISSNNNFGMRIDIAPDHAIFIKDTKVDDLIEDDFIFTEIYVVD